MKYPYNTGRMIDAKKSAIVDKSYLGRVFSHNPSEERVRFLDELLRSYRIVIPFILIEEILIDLARPKTEQRARIARLMANFIAAHATNWIDDDIQIVFQELILNQPISPLPALPKEIIDKIAAQRVDDPKLVRLVSQMGEHKYKTVIEKRTFQDGLVPSDSEKCFETPAAFMKEAIHPFFLAKLKDSSASCGMLEAYFGKRLRQSRPDLNAKIDAAFDAYRPDTADRFPFTTAWLIVHLTYMRAPLVKIGPDRQRRSLPCLISRGKGQINHDSDEKYVAAAMMCDRILTCDEGMKNVAEAIRAGGNWSGEVVYFHPKEDLLAQIPKLV